MLCSRDVLVVTHTTSKKIACQLLKLQRIVFIFYSFDHLFFIFYFLFYFSITIYPSAFYIWTALHPFSIFDTFIKCINLCVIFFKIPLFWMILFIYLFFSSSSSSSFSSYFFFNLLDITYIVFIYFILYFFWLLDFFWCSCCSCCCCCRFFILFSQLYLLVSRRFNFFVLFHLNF